MFVCAQVDKVTPKARLLSVSTKLLDSGLQFDWPGVNHCYCIST